jgi:acetyl-CoA synthetase
MEPTFNESFLKQAHLGPAPITQAPFAQAHEWWSRFNRIEQERPNPTDCWRALLSSRLLDSLPLPLHAACFNHVYRNWLETAQGPRPAWFPQRPEQENSNLARAMKARGFNTYSQLFDWSAQDRAGYWNWAIDQVGIRFHQRFDSVLDISQGPHHPRWLGGAKLNIAESCFSAPKEKVALVCVSESGHREQWTYGELQDAACQIAASLKAKGHQPSERFAVFMPMNAQSVAIYLGVVLFGGAIVSIADSFSTEEINTRLRISGATTVFTQDAMVRGGRSLDLYSRVHASIASRAIVIRTTDTELKLRKGDLFWDDFIVGETEFEATSMLPTDVSNVLFSSGTTGDPKAIPWTHTTPIKAAVDGYFHQDIQSTDTVCWPTNLGWMMGPWLIYATLVNGARLALYDGGTAARAFGEFVQNEKVTVLGLVPSIVKHWQERRTMEALDWSHLKCFSSTGECSNAQEYLYLMALAGYRPIIEYCGGTEIGGAYLTSTLLQPNSPATFSTPALGLDFEILDEAGQPTTQGEVYLAPPSIGLSETLLNRNHDEVYRDGVPPGHRYPELRRHGDQLESIGHGYYRALGRADDTMNLGGIKVSSAEIERVLNRVPEVSETAAIAITPRGGGPSLLVVFACLKQKQTDTKLLQASLQSALKTDLNPLFKIHEVVISETLPRTASNKVMRRVLRQQYETGT